MNRRERMNEQIRVHGENLKALFGVDMDADKLARKVHSLEIKAHRLATDYCNGGNGVDTETWGPLTNEILDKLDNILNYRSQCIPVFVNSDARGYALKVNDGFMLGYRSGGGKLHTDWGGYGILAPEFDGKE